MEKRSRRTGLWIGLGALIIIAMCVMLTGLGTLLMLRGHSGPAQGMVPQVQAPATEQGGAVPAPYYSHHSMGRFGGFGPLGFIGFGIRMIFRLVFFGLLLAVFVGLTKCLFWGRRHRWAHCHGKAPEGEDEEWGPMPWHGLHKNWHRKIAKHGPPPWWGRYPDDVDDLDDADEPGEVD